MRWLLVACATLAGCASPRPVVGDPIAESLRISVLMADHLMREINADLMLGRLP